MSEEVLLKNGIKEATVSIIKDLLNVQALSLNRMQTEFLQSGFLEKDKVQCFRTFSHRCSLRFQ